MLLKRIELLLDPSIKDMVIIVRHDDGRVEMHGLLQAVDGDRVRIYEGVTVSRRELED